MRATRVLASSNRSSTRTDQYGNPITGNQELWLYEGRKYPQFALNAVIDKDPKDFGLEPYRFDQILRGCYDPSERVKDMDIDGVWAQLCFPSFPRFGGTLFLESEDWDLALLCVQAYNDFIIDEWAGTEPERLIPMIIVPLWDPALAAVEVERCAGKGAKAITFPEATRSARSPLDPLRSLGPTVCHGAGDPVAAVHALWQLRQATRDRTRRADSRMDLDDGYEFDGVAQRTCSSRRCSTSSRVCASGLAEGGIGWISYLLQRMDFVWERHRWYTGINTEVPPSELFRKHIWGCFIEDEAGLREREFIGIDHICFESDYPHSDSLWPNSRKRLSEMLADVPDDEAVRIAELNARKLLNFDADLK